MDSDFSQTLTGGRAGFSALLEAVEEHLSRHGVPPGAIGPVLIAADELVTNVLNHGAGPSGEPHIEVVLRLTGGQVTVEIVDDGPAFNPIDAPVPDTSLSIEERDIGGLGIHLVRKLMDAVDYQRTDGRNRLRFEKAYTLGSPPS